LASATSDEVKENLQQDILAINEYLAEEQEALYGYLEEIGEVAMQKLEKNLEKAKKNMERALTGGNTFDDILADMDRVS